MFQAYYSSTNTLLEFFSSDPDGLPNTLRDISAKNLHGCDNRLEKKNSLARVLEATRSSKYLEKISSLI